MKNSLHHLLVWNDYSPNDCIDPAGINLFKITIDSFGKISDKYPLILNGAELNKAGRFISAQDAERYILGKYYLRMILAAMLNKSPKDLVFAYTKKKKPYLSEIQFNLSHSGNYVLIATGTYNLGIDVERIQTAFDYQALLEGNFNPAERQKIRNVKDFYTLWTRKEAVLKATGEGLIDRLEELDSLQDQVSRMGLDFRLITSDLDEEHLMSLAIQSPSGYCNYWRLNDRS